MIRSVLAATAFAFMAGSALAMPVLRGDITVSSAIVTVGDMFDNAGVAAENGLFRAPVPGTAGALTLSDITAAAKAAGVETFDATGLETVRVARSGIVLAESHLSDLIAADLSARGILSASMSMQVSLDASLPVLHAADASAPANLEMLRYMPGSSSFSARFRVAGIDTPLDVNGQIQLMIEAPHLARALSAGEILSPSDVEMRMIPLNYAETTGLPALEELVGMQIQRPTRAGVLIRPSDVAAPELISRNDTVTVIYRNGAMTLSIRGQALNAASLDQPVSVMNLMSKKVLRGVAAGAGTVIVNHGNEQVAGL